MCLRFSVEKNSSNISGGVGMEVHTYRQHNIVSKAETVDVELGKVANLSRISIWELRNNRRA